MNAIRPIAQTEDTVTLNRADYERLLELLEDAEDIAALEAAAAREEALGEEAAHADYLHAGNSFPGFWRASIRCGIGASTRGLSQEQLAGNAHIARSYLAEIEGRKKPGSLDAYRKLANALGLTVDDLMPEDETGAPR